MVSGMRRALESADDWELAGIMALSAAAKSLVAALALARGRLRASEALAVVRLEARKHTRERGTHLLLRHHPLSPVPPARSQPPCFPLRPCPTLSCSSRVRLSVYPCLSACPQESHQYDEWGYVQGGHDIDDADFRVRRADTSDGHTGGHLGEERDEGIHAVHTCCVPSEIWNSAARTPPQVGGAGGVSSAAEGCEGARRGGGGRGGGGVRGSRSGEAA